MVYVYKLPTDLNPEALRQYTGTMGTIIDPVLDADGSFVISKEEWESQEFQYLKNEFSEIVSKFEKIEWKPPVIL